MTAVTDSRKRSRDEENCDFMPISKRINNLSINNPYIADNNIMAIIQQPEPSHGHGYGSLHHDQHLHLHSGHHQHQNNGNVIGADSYCHMNNNYMEHARPSVTNNHSARNGIGNGGGGEAQQLHHHHQQQQSASGSAAAQSNDEFMGLECYNPELTQDENPFYYNKNKLLFDLHIERQRRHPNT